MTLGKRIKLIRKDSGLNQTKFAEKLGSTFGAFSKYEIDKVVPNDVFIKQLCTTFNVNEHWLRTGEEGPYNSEAEDNEFRRVLGELEVEDDEIIKKLIPKIRKLKDEELLAINTLVDSILKEEKNTN